MAILYTYTKYKDNHYLTNNELVSLNYLIEKVTCDATTQVASGVILPTKSYSIPLKVDGQYRISLTKQGDVPETEVLQDILFYNNLLLSFLTVAQKVLCGCTISRDCNDDATAEEYLDAFMKAYAFGSVNNPMYKDYFNIIAEDSACAFNNDVLCTMLTEKVYGKEDPRSIMLKILAYYYCAFYFKDKYMTADAEELVYLNSKYKFDTISKCMRKIGIDPASVITLFESDSTVYYWQLANTTDDITNVIPLITSMYLATKPNAPFATFEAGNMVDYTTVGRIVFAISPTAVQDFIITDSLNNDITNDFDVQYIPGYSTALFVSKNVLSFGTIYFKFKKLI